VTDERARSSGAEYRDAELREEWEAKPAPESCERSVALLCAKTIGWRRALTVSRMLDGVGTGNLCRLREQNHYGRELRSRRCLASGEVALVKWLKKEITKKPAKTPNPPSQSYGAAGVQRESDKSRAGANVQ